MTLERVTYSTIIILWLIFIPYLSLPMQQIQNKYMRTGNYF